MNKNILFLLFICGSAIAAQLGSLRATNDVTTATEMAAYAVDPASIQLQITTNATSITSIDAILADGITTNLISTNVWTLAITNGVIKGVE